MKHANLVLSVLLGAALATGCTTADAASSARPVRGEGATAREMEDYVYERKTEFIEKMTDELDELQEELDHLASKVDESRGAAKADARLKLDAVREKWGLAKKRLQQAENATESTWDEVKHSFEKLNGELKDSFEKARQWLSDAIEP